MSQPPNLAYDPYNPYSPQTGQQITPNDSSEGFQAYQPPEPEKADLKQEPPQLPPRPKASAHQDTSSSQQFPASASTVDQDASKEPELNQYPTPSAQQPPPQQQQQYPPSSETTQQLSYQTQYQQSQQYPPSSAPSQQYPPSSAPSQQYPPSSAGQQQSYQGQYQQAQVIPAVTAVPSPSSPTAYPLSGQTQSLPLPTDHNPGAEQRLTCYDPSNNADRMDPNTKAGKLYHNMAQVVGYDNILLPPFWLTSDKDRKLWLKSDSNALLYYWYKSPVVREEIEEHLENGTVCEFCTNDYGEFNGMSCCCVTCFCVCCPCYTLTVCFTDICAPENVKQDGIISWGEDWMYEDQASKDKILQGQAVVSWEKFKDEVYPTVWRGPLYDAGFKRYDDGFLNFGWCWARTFQPCYTNRYRHVLMATRKGRYGKFPRSMTGVFVPKLDMDISTGMLIKSQAFRDYRQNCLRDLQHPRTIGDKSGGLKNYYGHRDVFLSQDWDTARPFEELTKSRLPRLVQRHNHMWGRIKPLNPDLLDLDYIYPRQ